jgi:hypothetical protein
MDLLSMVGLATKRRSDYFKQAESLAKKTKTWENLEEKMKAEAKVIVKGLRDKQMRWDEYERTLIDKTLVSALVGVYLGSQDKDPQGKMEKTWPTIVGDMLPPLAAFLDETKSRIDDGTLRLGDKTLDFADADIEQVMESYDPYDTSDPEVQAAIEEANPRGVGQTWLGTLGRVVRYIATPAFSFFNLGQFINRQEQGYREMRRVARHDKRVCKDCLDYDRLGWQPIGSLPMPGRGCRCYDHCRCYIEYR